MVQGGCGRETLPNKETREWCACAMRISTMYHSQWLGRTTAWVSVMSVMDFSSTNVLCKWLASRAILLSLLLAQVGQCCWRQLSPRDKGVTAVAGL
jgi:hypothetical protein